jgi:hypothetical protein
MVKREAEEQGTELGTPGREEVERKAKRLKIEGSGAFPSSLSFFSL